MSDLLEVKHLSKDFVTRTSLLRRHVEHAVEPVSFTLTAGKTLGIIGQNGSGKSTLAKMLAGVIEPTSGEIWVNGEQLAHKDYATRCKLIRMIFQDPNTSLNPRIQI
ncbi:MAG: ATP-binding cassette domain-containing protein, partial [Vibrio sp.]